MGAFAQLEQALIHDRQHEGIATAKASWRLPGPSTTTHTGAGG